MVHCLAEMWLHRVIAKLYKRLPLSPSGACTPCKNLVWGSVETHEPSLGLERENQQKKFPPFVQAPISEKVASWLGYSGCGLDRTYNIFTTVTHLCK